MAKTKMGIKPKNRFFLFKRILNLMINKAPLKQYYLELGVYFLKKGCGYDIGQIIKEKRLDNKTYRVKIITGLNYNFRDNKITHTAENRIVTTK